MADDIQIETVVSYTYRYVAVRFTVAQLEEREDAQDRWSGTECDGRYDVHREADVDLWGYGTNVIKGTDNSINLQ